MMRLSVIAPGEPVEVVKADGERVPALISAIDIRYPDRVLYEVVFWDESERLKDWVEPFEVEGDNAKRLEIDSET